MLSQSFVTIVVYTYGNTLVHLPLSIITTKTTGYIKMFDSYNDDIYAMESIHYLQ